MQFTNDAKAINFAFFDADRMRLTIDKGATTNSTAGKYTMGLTLTDDAPDDVGGPMSSFYEFNLYIKRNTPIYTAEGTLVTADSTSGEQNQVPLVTEIYVAYNETEDIPIDPVIEINGDAFDYEFEPEDINAYII